MKSLFSDIDLPGTGGKPPVKILAGSPSQWRSTQLKCFTPLPNIAPPVTCTALPNDLGWFTTSNSMIGSFETRLKKLIPNQTQCLQIFIYLFVYIENRFSDFVSHRWVATVRRQPPQRHLTKGRSPGLVLMGGETCFEGRGFEPQRRILDGYFSHVFAVIIVMFVWKDENKLKRGRDGPFKKDI